MTQVHFVGSVGLDTAQDVMATIGRRLGPHLKRVPDGEPGGRRLWISWQYPLLRACAFLTLSDKSNPRPTRTGLSQLMMAEGCTAKDVHFGELGYAREARASYQDFCELRQQGTIPKGVRFQVSLPTPRAVIGAFCEPQTAATVLPVYTEAMMREVAEICRRIPHDDLTIQWDVCMEMVMWDASSPAYQPFPGFEAAMREMFAELGRAVPADVELGIHLCYGDFEAKHFCEPKDTSKMVEFARIIFETIGRPVGYLHLPVPIDRADDAYYAPLRDFALPKGTELYLGLVHGEDGIEGTRKRMEVAKRYVHGFGIATECGLARARSVDVVNRILDVYADAAEVPTA